MTFVLAERCPRLALARKQRVAEIVEERQRRGVSIDELQCPSCGSEFEHALHRDEPELGFASLTRSPVLIAQTATPYLRCEHGHKWSVTWLTRYEDGRPDSVALGYFMGGDW